MIIHRKTGIYTSLIISLAVAIVGTCTQEGVGPQSIPVTVSILVLHKAGSELTGALPTQGAWVELFNGDGSPIDPQRLFKKETDNDGRAVFKENNDVFHPRATYKVRVSYFNSKTVSDFFTVPQYPNRGTEYFIEKTVYHTIGDSLYTPARPVIIITKVTEKDPRTGQFIPSANALVSILKPNGSPILPNFTYTKVTDSNGIAEIIANDFYLVPGLSYKAKIEKSNFTPAEVLFQIPSTPNYENSFVVELEVQLINQ